MNSYRLHFIFVMVTNESLLHRSSRVVLFQLRSGFCARLRDYQCRIGKTVDDVCQECHAFPQTVSHLFECPSHPTTLTTLDLWKRPWSVINHIVSFPSFDFLPCPGPPPPLPLRRRRPPPAPPDPPVTPPFSPIDLPDSFVFTPPPIPPLLSQRPQAPRYARLSRSD